METAANVASRKILVVDDSEFVHQIFRVAFRKIGNCTLFHAKNGQEGLLELDRSGPVDLIVLDLNMPVMDGLRFLDEMRSRRRDFGTHVLVASTEDRDGMIREALIRGAQSFIKKPFTLEQVVELLNRVIPTLLRRAAAPGA